MAPRVGLDPLLLFDDVKTFTLRRSRIPTSLFKSIVEEIDKLILHYGPIDACGTEVLLSSEFSIDLEI